MKLSQSYIYWECEMDIWNGSMFYIEDNTLNTLKFDISYFSTRLILDHTNNIYF